MITCWMTDSAFAAVKDGQLIASAILSQGAWLMVLDGEQISCSTPSQMLETIECTYPLAQIVKEF